MGYTCRYGYIPELILSAHIQRFGSVGHFDKSNKMLHVQLKKVTDIHRELSQSLEVTHNYIGVQ